MDVGVVGRILVDIGSGGEGQKGQFRVCYACTHTKTSLLRVYPRYDLVRREKTWCMIREHVEAVSCTLS